MADLHGAEDDAAAGGPSSQWSLLGSFLPPMLATTLVTPAISHITYKFHAIPFAEMP